MEKTIQTRAVLVSLRLTGWTARTGDEAATQDVIARASAASGVAKVMKQLVAKTEVSTLQKNTTRVRRAHYELTLPWDDGGKRLLPIDLHDRYQKTMDDLIAKRQRSLKRFLSRFDEAKDKAREELGTLYNEDDYPTKAEIEDKFQAVYEFTPVPSTGHFIADMADADAAKIRDSIDAGVKARVDGAVTDVYRRLGRFIDSGIYLPSLHSEGMPSIVLAIDTSQSLDEDQLAELWTEMRAAVGDVEPESVTVIQCDTRVTAIDEYHHTDMPVELDARGRGGTRFAPVFDAIQEMPAQPACVIYFTDMGSSDFGDDPGVPVLWAVQRGAWGIGYADVPFGEMIEL